MNTQKPLTQCPCCHRSLTADSAVSLYQGKVYCQSCQRPHPPVHPAIRKAIRASQARSAALLRRA